MSFSKSLEYGGHALVWSGDWTPEGARKAISGAARAGYDYIEIALLDPWKVDVVLTKDLLQEFNLRAHASLGLSASTDVTSTNLAIVAKGDELLRKATDVLYAIGGTELCGVIYCALGKYPGPASKENRANSVAAMQRLADYAADKGINIDLEVVNRYETNIMNTGLEGLAFLDEVNRPNAYLHLDTYHMNIEEKDIYRTVVATGALLCHVHTSENDRGIPGTGHVDWDGLFRGLFEIHYDGWVVLESFFKSIPEIADFTPIWRTLAPSADALAKQGLEYLKGKIKQYQKK